MARSGSHRCLWAWLRSAPPPCAASRAPPAGTWTGARAPAAGRAPVTHPPDHPAPGRRGPPPPDRPPGLQRAARTPALPPPSTAVPRAPSTAWGPSDVGSATKCLSRPRPLDSDSSSSPPTASPAPEGRAGLSTCGGTRRPLLPETSSAPARWRPGPRGAWQPAPTARFLSPVDLVVLPRTQFSSQFAAVSLRCAFCPTQ
ncbi:splicing factor, proline- and glutamine-rich-like [Neovison vison]|uniref:splicing factor, proline- and glutamine-rich-like n=1 Tax=Neovison vison TaxID=452646 RepID=UPI001CF0002F|nr:splicing factor, proline- and glutamine-rich-like [Neogale vison]